MGRRAAGGGRRAAGGDLRQAERRRDLLAAEQARGLGGKGDGLRDAEVTLACTTRGSSSRRQRRSAVRRAHAALTVGGWDMEAVPLKSRRGLPQVDCYATSQNAVRPPHRQSPSTYLLPLARLCVTQSISQLSRSVAPPLDQALTWSASIPSRA